MRTSDTMPAVGIILAGGRGRRFGGIDKAFVDLAGKALVQHVMERIAAQVGALILNSNSESPKVRALGLPVTADRSRSTLATGPLVGLTSVLAEIEARGDASSPLLSVPVDTPFLPGDLVGRLSAALAETGAPVAYAATALRDHPIVALWDARARDSLRVIFDREPDLSLHGLMKYLQATGVIFDHTPVDPFFNINTTQDLDAAQRIVSQPDGAAWRPPRLPQ